MADTATMRPDELAKHKTASRLIREIERAEQFWKKYRARCDRVLTRYEDEREEKDNAKGKHRYNIFWSNIETLKAAAYARVPQATCLSRFDDADIVARTGAEVMERAINFSNDCYDWDQVLKDVRDEFLILAKGHSWTRYVPTFGEPAQTQAVEQEPNEEPGEQRSGIGGIIDSVKAAVGSLTAKQATVEGEAPSAGEQGQEVTYEQAISDYVSYQDILTNKARKWSEVWLLIRICYLNRTALKKRFGNELGAQIPLDFKKPDSDKSEAEDDQQAMVYECWDKREKKAYWISKSWPMAPLDERPDPLGLEEFFPCPKFALGTTSPRSLIPIPDYVQYQDLCQEVDTLTARIDVLTSALRVVGIYAGDEKQVLQQVFKPNADNQMIQVDGWAVFAEKGGIKGVMEFVPIEIVANVLKGLYDARDRAIVAIYQICAISDIMRGDTDPDETAAAQKLKSTWGSSRVREKQKEMGRFARDDMRIRGEVIAKKFSIQTIKLMTNVQLLTREELAVIQRYEQATAALQEQQKAQQAAMMAQAQAQPPAPGQPQQPPPQMPVMPPPPPPFPPAKMELVSKPTWEDIDELFKADGLRQFRIDIEADSHIEPDMLAARRDMTEFAGAFGKLIGESLPIVQAAPPFGKIIAVAAKKMCRTYEFGREMEDVIDKVMGEIAGMPPTPPPGAEKVNKGKSPEELAIMAASVENDKTKNQIAAAGVQADAQNSAADAQTNAASVAAELERTKSAERIAALEASVEKMKAMVEAMTRHHEATKDADTRLEEAAAAERAAKASKPEGVT